MKTLLNILVLPAFLTACLLFALRAGGALEGRAGAEALWLLGFVVFPGLVYVFGTLDSLRGRVDRISAELEALRRERDERSAGSPGA